jgi:hypothetical protein
MMANALFRQALNSKPWDEDMVSVVLRESKSTWPTARASHNKP